MQMERRDLERLPVEFPVEFIVLGHEGGSRRQGVIRNVSAEGLCLTTDTTLETGGFLRIEIEDAFFFGEVRYCNPCAGGSIAGLYIEQVLMGQSAWARLLALAQEHCPQLASMMAPQ
jgi:hypothetical protein